MFAWGYLHKRQEQLRRFLKRRRRHSYPMSAYELHIFELDVHTSEFKTFSSINFNG